MPPLEQMEEIEAEEEAMESGDLDDQAFGEVSDEYSDSDDEMEL